VNDQSSAAATDPWLGRVIDQRYRIVEQLGRGATGVVYRIEHVRMGKIAAMKLLHSSLSTDPALTRRFHNEAEAISRLNHPNIVQVFDFGQADDTLYIVMEYLHGLNLGAILERDGPLPLSRCVPILVQVCDALTEAHSLGIIHRDLKPENIQISRTHSGRDVVKVVDFGLAKMVQPGSEPGQTGKGKLVGTPYYMSPEQIRGHDLDQRCDIYGLGAVAYRLLTGAPPFDAETPMGVLTKHVTEPPIAPSERSPTLEIPREIDEVLLRTMAKRREKRFPAADAFKEALLRAANQAASRGAAPAADPDNMPVLIERRLPPPEEGADETGPPAPAMGDGRPSLTDSPNPPMVSWRSSEIETPLAATATARSIDTELPRLTREDVDFEDTLRRGGWLRLAAVLVVLLGLAGAVYWFALREQPETPATREREPNNAPAQATLIASGQPVAGQLGKRLSEQESDRDWYRLELEGGADQALRVVVGGIPNMDLTVELYDGEGKQLAAADSAAQGLGETLVDWPISGDTAYVLVREVWRMGTIPTENVTDEYALVARRVTLNDNAEREPNDTPEQANDAPLGQPIRATLGKLGDRDTYRIDAPAGTFSLSVTPVEGVDMALELSGKGLRRRQIDARATSGGERLTQLRLRRPTTLLLTVRRKDERKGTDAPPPGLDQPYTLELR
jgi:serine/threonine protein kinase